jgi:ribosomal protein S18 acetylase RimI-like enzyme
MSIANETTVGAATRADAPELARLINSAYRAHGGSAGWTSETDLLTGTRTDVTSLVGLLAEQTPQDALKATFLLLRRKMDATLVGCICLEPQNDISWYLSLLAVDPDEQNSGYGRLVLAEAEKFVYASGALTARITVIQQRETLIAWYERRGYRRTGEVIPFPYHDSSVGTPLRSDLELIVLEKSLNPKFV